MNVRLDAARFYGALVIGLSFWVLHSFVPALLVACVTAIASWPLYRRFSARLAPGVGRRSAPLVFTVLMSVFVLAPAMLALGALVTEAETLLAQISAADREGIAVPQWVANLPVAGSWLSERWQTELARPGALWEWALRTDPAALFGWAGSLGQFMARQLYIIGFTVLVLFFLYQEGESLTEGLRRWLRYCMGERVEGYVDLATRAVRSSVNSMLVVGLFDGFATWLVFAGAGTPHPVLWAAIIGSLALVPFLGYVGLTALMLQLVMNGNAAAAVLSFGLGCAVLFVGDKILRPMVARDGTRLGFVWVLMGCLGGFQALGLVGLVIGPVVLTLARELWVQRVRDLAGQAVTGR